MQAILFDLDGTLLPMDMDTFIKGYFGLLAKKAAGYGYESEAVVKGTWKGTYAMVQNDGSMTNKERFWKTFAGIFGEKVYDDIPIFDSFYENEFNEAAAFANPDPEKAREALKKAREHADKVILATNPLFPRGGVETRLQWLGLSINDFDYVTTYENSTYCKPNPKYYQELLAKNHFAADQCLMIGNDVEEDVLAAQTVGLKTYLVTDCILTHNKEIPDTHKGTFEEMLKYLEM